MNAAHSPNPACTQNLLLVPVILQYVEHYKRLRSNINLECQERKLAASRKRAREQAMLDCRLSDSDVAPSKRKPTVPLVRR